MIGQVTVQLGIVSDHAVLVIEQQAVFSMHVSHLDPSFFALERHAVGTEGAVARVDPGQSSCAHPIHDERG